MSNELRLKNIMSGFTNIADEEELNVVLFIQPRRAGEIAYLVHGDVDEDDITNFIEHMGKMAGHLERVLENMPSSKG